MKPVVVRIKTKAGLTEIPKPMRDMIERGPDNVGLGDFIQMSHDCGYTCTLLIERTGEGTVGTA